MIVRCAAMLIPLFLIGCAGESDPQPVPPDNEGSAVTDDAAKPTEAAETKSGEPETAETETVDAQAVSTETIVMKVPGMH